MIGRIFEGMGAGLRGLTLGGKSKRLRRTWLILGLTILGVTLLLYGLGWWALAEFTDAEPEASRLVAAGWLALRLLGGVMILIASPIVAFFLVRACVPLLSERVFIEALRAIDGPRAARLEELPGLPVHHALWTTVRRLLRFVVLAMLTLPLAFVPVIGAPLAWALQGFLAVNALGSEMLEPYLDKRGLHFPEQMAYVKRNRPALVGFAFPYALVIAIPLVGPFMFCPAQAAAALLVAEVLDPKESEIATKLANPPGVADGSGADEEADA